MRRMRFKTNLKSSVNLIDLTPLVDVIFLMLVFFIITSDILPLKSLNIQNPKLEKESDPLTTKLFVVMDAQHVIYLGSKKLIVDFNSLKFHLEEEIDQIKKQYGNLDPTLVLSVDQAVEYGSFLRLFSIAQECCPHLRLVYKQSDED